MTPIAAILGGWEIILILAAFCVVAVVVGGIALAIYFATRKSQKPSAQRPPPVAQTVRSAQPPPIPATQRSQPPSFLRSDSLTAPPEHIPSTASTDSVSAFRRFRMSYAVGGISILIALFAAWYWWPDRPEPGQTCRYTANFKFDYPKFTDCLIDCNPNLYCIMDIEGVGRYLMPVYTQN